MIRGGRGPSRIAWRLACALASLAVAAPATASAAPAVDEYSLDLPQAGGSQPADPSAPPPSGVAASGGPSGSAAGESGAGAVDTDAAATQPGQKQQEEDENVPGFAAFHGGHATLDTDSRAFPEVIADALFDSAMLPVVAALALITAVGAWRVLRGRRTLTGEAG
jgi:hypothetical protein